MTNKKAIEYFYNKIACKFTFHNNRSLDKLKKRFYNEIKRIDKLKKPNFEIKKTKKSMGSLSKSHYVSKKAKEKLDKIKYCYKSTFMLNKLSVEINLIGAKSNETESIILNVYRLLSFLYEYNETKMNTLKIILFLNNNDKKINNKYEILSPKHVNTAVTYACATDGEVFLYRREEWFKVLCHELMHSLCLDFSGLNINNMKENMKKLFNLKSDYEISETYSEFWATIINSVFISYDISNSYSKYKENLNMIIDIEKTFSLYQTIKILKYMKIDKYSLLTDKLSHLYEEKTNVFAYYILKSILLYKYDSFIEQCKKENTPGNPIFFYKSPGNLNSFFNYILKHYQDEELLEDFEKMELLYDKVNNEKLKKTMRMTIFDKKI
tara:strand:+ start:1024 stop:2166 length:1143 start_codon:yes stop_codon:yes gene_type:complete